MKRCVIFAPNPLVLTEIRLNAAGRPAAGRVRNGSWDFAWDGVEATERPTKTAPVICRWFLSELPYIDEIPDDVWAAGFNTVIQWAKDRTRK